MTVLSILDRTSELRKKGFTGRRLGPVQMTTDTAVRVTRMVIEEQCKLTSTRHSSEHYGRTLFICLPDLHKIL